MKKLLVISAISISFLLVCGLGVTANMEVAGAKGFDNGASVTLSGIENFSVETGYEPSWVQELAVLENCPETTAALGGGAQASSCTPYGYLCDPRYVTGAVCCPGNHCISPYPNVPKFCL